MDVYVLERAAPDSTPEQLTAAQQMLADASHRYAAAGHRVRYLRSLYLPSDGRVFYLFAAASAILVRDITESVGIPFIRITEAVDLPADAGE